MVSQTVIPNWQVLGGSMPYAFTEQGVAMLSAVLKSAKAVNVSIDIMRAFVQLRRIASIHADIFSRLDTLESRFDSLHDLVESLLIQESKPKNKIGFIDTDKLKK